jgi:hypothetical protein
MDFDVGAAFRSCITRLDVKGIRNLHRRFNPHLPQPKDDEEALTSLHIARTQAKFLSERERQYSRDWLAERQTGRIAHAVGVSVGMPSQPLNSRQEDVRDAMSDSAGESYKKGLDLDKDAPEVKGRMMEARRKIHRFRNSVRGFRLGSFVIGVQNGRH